MPGFTGFTYISTTSNIMHTPVMIPFINTYTSNSLILTPVMIPFTNTYTSNDPIH